jgi:hypothetical protein
MWDSLKEFVIIKLAAAMGLATNTKIFTVFLLLL